MERFQARFFGGFALSDPSGREITVRGRKTQGLFAYLALNAGKRVDRGTLVDLFWGDRGDAQARQSLRRSLSDLRQAIGARGGQLLVGSGDTLTFDADAIRVDVLTFAELAERGAFAEAAALLGGPLLDGLSARSGPFDEWLEGERRTLNAVACGVLLKLAETRLEAGDFEAATAAAEKLVALDPLREGGQRALIRAYDGLGRRSQAIRQYQDCAALLDRELGVAPEPETVALFEEIKARKGRPADARAEASARRPRMLWPGAAAAAAVIVLGFVVLRQYGLRGPLPATSEPPTAAGPAALAAKPSLAVLPFDDLTEERSQGHLADGLTEDLITALSRVPRLFVIARHSVAMYKGKPVKVQEIARDLGVGYVLEGSVQREDNRLRVNAQLVDARDGRHLWARRYDREAKDFFALQDEIVRMVLIELQVALTAGDNARIASRGTRNLDAWLHRVQGLHEGLKFTREGMARAREHFLAAIELDPDWSRPVAGLAWLHWYEARRGWTDDRAAWIDRGIALAEKAIAMDPEDPLGYMQLGNLMALQGSYERAVALREKAVSLAPNDFLANWGLGAMLTWTGRSGRALEVFELAKRVSPHQPASFVLSVAQAQFQERRREAALRSLDATVARRPEWVPARLWRVMAYGDLGRKREAREEAAEVLRLRPGFSVSGWMKSSLYQDRAVRNRHTALLRAAGLPH